MKTLTSEEWKLLQEVQDYLRPKENIRQFELIAIRNARRILGKDEDTQDTLG